MTDSITESRDLGIRSDLNPDAFEVRCPYLGLKHDHATILGFPNVLNNCFRHDRPIPVNLKIQSQLCLSDQYESCVIFQQVPAEQAENNESLAPQKDADSKSKWMRRARPALIAIPLLLLIAAALIWWPAPGTSVQDNTSNAAPLQKITAPSEISPVTGSAIEYSGSESSQADGENDSSALNSNQGELEAASQADGSPDGAVQNDEAAGRQSNGFRILTYD